MADEPEAPEEEGEPFLTFSETLAYPDADWVEPDEARRAWCLWYLMESGRAALDAAKLCKEARVIEGYLRGDGASLRVVEK